MVRFLLALILFAHSALQAERALHVCTVALESSQGLSQLLKSCKRQELTLKVIRQKEGHQDDSRKLRLVQEYLKTLPERDLFLYVDPDDVLILADEKRIVAAFQELKVPFVMAVERFCYPYAARASEFPLTPFSFRYLNSGTYMGSVGALKKLFAALPAYKLEERDQGVFMRHFLNSPRKYAFDTHCALFMPFAGVIEQELEVGEGRVVCKETGAVPCVIHGNGGSRPLYQNIYNILF